MASGTVLRFGSLNKKVDVLRHDDVSVDAKLKTSSDSFKCDLKSLLGSMLNEGWPAMVPAERHKVTLSGFVKAL